MVRVIKKFVITLATTKLLKFPRSLVEKIISYGNGVIIFYYEPERSVIIDLIRKIKSENELLLGYNEAYQIYMAVRRTVKIKGHLAEVGVYKGGSAKLICEAKGDRVLHLFDTFKGLPSLSERDNPKQFCKGQYLTSLNQVKNYLKKYPNINFYKGLFPSTAVSVRKKRFSFVNLDVDIYTSTLSCLKFFYPRMNKGGVIISDDYMTSLGVKKAIDDYFKNKPEPIIELSGSQCLIVKL
jgi:hypothetical protein